MGVSILDPIEYGRLCGEIVPKAIETDEEFDRLVAQMEALDFKENPHGGGRSAVSHTGGAHPRLRR